MRIYKNENGSITLFVLVSMLFLTMFLATIYTLSTNNEIAQRNATAKLKETYENGLESIEETYNNLEQAKAYNKDGNEIKDFEQGWNFNYDNDTEIWRIGYFGEEEVTEENTPYYIKCGNIEAYAKTMSNYIIKGNSIQNGTPTPTSPSPVSSLGETSRNLFDFSISNLEKMVIAPDNYQKYGFNLGVLPAGNYTLKCYLKENENFPPYMYFRSRNGDVFGTERYVYTNVIENNPLTFEADGESEYLFYFAASGGSSEATSTEYVERFAGIQLESGKIATGYRPYKYKYIDIDIVSSGKNLFDMNTIESDSYGYWINRHNPVLLKAGKTYTASIGISPTPSGFYLYNTSENAVAAWYDSKVVKYTPTEDILVMGRVWKGVRDALTYPTKWQLEEGNNITNYEPYHQPITLTIDLAGHEPLRKIGDVADYIDYKNKKIVRNILEIVLTGQETWYQWTNIDFSPTYQFYSLLQNTFNNKGKYVCTHLTVDTAKSRNWKMELITPNGLANVLTIGINQSRLSAYSSSTPIDKLKEWLSEQYANGTPVTIDYILSTPIEEYFESPELPIAKGSNIYSVDADVQPSEFIIEY